VTVNVNVPPAQRALQDNPVQASWKGWQEDVLGFRPTCPQGVLESSHNPVPALHFTKPENVVCGEQPAAVTLQDQPPCCGS
jgi:hypothetical protein